jgi:hypothetical protein
MLLLTVWVATLYLLPGLDVSTAVSAPSRWDLSDSTYGRRPQVGVYGRRLSSSGC